ncbi:hypothetical protein ACFLXC_05635 [Chloroflexota bacterium]
MWRTLPWWVKVLVVLFSVIVTLVLLIVLLAKFWWLILIVALPAFFLYGWFRRKARETHIDVHYRDETPYLSRNRRIRTPSRSDIQRGSEWHIPKYNKDGVEFITGAQGLRKTQRDAMRKTKKNLWG